MDNQILKQWNTQKHTSTVSQKKKKKHTSTARGSEAANASVPSVSYISRTPWLSQIYTITPLSNLNGNSWLLEFMQGLLIKTWYKNAKQWSHCNWS